MSSFSLDGSRNTRSRRAKSAAVILGSLSAVAALVRLAFLHSFFTAAPEVPRATKLVGSKRPGDSRKNALNTASEPVEKSGTATAAHKSAAAPTQSVAPIDRSLLLGRGSTVGLQLAAALGNGALLDTASQAEATDRNLRLQQQYLKDLKAGRERFSHVTGYTAILFKRERIGSTLSDEVELQLKLRHEPFSVYMKWQSGAGIGKEVLYVAGTNDDQLLVRLGGFKGRLLPALKIDPYGSRAMGESRSPITKAGILALADELIEHREQELRDGIVPRMHREPDAACDGRPCAVWIAELSDRARSSIYRKSVQYIDREWGVPIEVVNYTWPESGQQLDGPALDEATLIEYYKYTEIETRVTDADFERSNAEYRFGR